MITTTTSIAVNPARARIAVAAIFCANGALVASWVSRIPDVKDALGLSPGALGLALLFAAIGALIAQPTVGWLIGRVGSRTITTVAGLVFCFTPLLLALAPSLPLLMLALLLFGAWNGGLDVAMNAQGALVEQRLGKPIMSSYHGLWSIGGLVGAGLGGLAAARGLPVLVHFAVAAAVGLAVIGTATRWLWPDAPDRTAAAGPLFALPSRALLALGVIALITLLCEGAVADWGAVYLRDILGSGAGLAAAGYSAFALLMAVCRLSGDWLIMRLGARAIVRGGGALTALGMAVALLSPAPLLSLIGFAAVGAGVAVIFPITLSAAARAPGLAPGAGIAGMATAGYTGFLVGPPLIGALAEAVGLRGALAVLVLGGALIAALAGAVAER